MIFQQVEAPERFDANQAGAATKPLVYDVPAAQDGHTGTVTASDRTCQQVAATNTLPESDMACRVAAIAICRSAQGRHSGARRRCPLRSVRVKRILGG